MTTLTPFTITYTSVPQWYTITFSTTWPTVYINSTSFAIKNHPWNANWVDISENWKKALTTVDYTRCTSPSPAGLTRDQWIDAVRALYV